MKFNDRHIFTLSGELVQGHRDHSHEEILRDNPRTIPQERKFIHGTFETEWMESPERNKPIPKHTHYLTYAVNENLPGSDIGFSFIAKEAELKHYKPALRTLLKHYSKRPNQEFEINLQFRRVRDNESHPVAERWEKATGKKPPRDGVFNLQSVEEISNFLNNRKAKPKRATVSREVPVVNTSKLGRVGPKIPKNSNMTDAERKFWERTGLGDSYAPIMSFKEFITEAKMRMGPGEPDLDIGKAFSSRGMFRPINAQFVEPSAEDRAKGSKIIDVFITPHHPGIPKFENDSKRKRKPRKPD